jgi:hypothetical protein
MFRNQQFDRCPSTQFVGETMFHSCDVLRCTHAAGHSGPHEARRGFSVHHWPPEPKHVGLSAELTALRKEIMGNSPMLEAERMALAEGHEVYRNYLKTWEIERDQSKHLFIPHPDDSRMCSVCGQASFEAAHVITGWHRETLMLREEVAALRKRTPAMVILMEVEELGNRHIKLTAPQLPGVTPVVVPGRMHLPDGCQQLGAHIQAFFKENGDPQTPEELDELMKRIHGFNTQEHKKRTKVHG